MNSKASPRPFGDILRQARRAAGLTQEDLAERARLSGRAISDLERGVKLIPRRATVALLIEALDLTGEERALFEASVRRSFAERLEPPDSIADSLAVVGAEMATSNAVLPSVSHGRYLGALPDHELVARDVELARVQAAIERTTSGHSALVLLAGEPGVGKTRLAQEAMVLAQTAGLQVVTGRCYAEHMSSPFFPFLEALTAAWLAASSDLRGEAAQRFADLGRLLPDLLPIPLLPAHEDPRLRLLRAVTGFLTALARQQPLAVLLDDLHWADNGTLDLFLHLARALHGTRVLLLGAYRDVDVDHHHPLETVLAELSRERLAEMIKLYPLSQASTGTLIGVHFATTAISEEMTALVHEQTAGNPFFIEELLKALVDSGIIYKTEQGWERKAVTTMKVPFSIRAVVSQRLAEFPEAEQDVLRLASVLGQEFDLDVLLEASVHGEKIVLSGLDAALSMRLLEERQVGQGERLAFVHALVAQALYDEAPRHRQRRLHVEVGEALLRARGERPEIAAELARHFRLGGDQERAAHFAEIAGDHAMKLYARAEAEHHYRAALAAYQERHEAMATAVVQRKLAETLIALQRLDEAFDLLEEARLLVESMDDAYGRALVHRQLAVLAITRAGHQAGRPDIEQALALWPVEQEDADLVRLLYDATCIVSMTSTLEAAEPYAVRMMTLAEKLHDPSLQALALLNMCLLETGKGAPSAALRAYLDRGVSLARRVGDWGVLAEIAMLRGDHLCCHGDPRRGLEDFRQVLEIAERVDLTGFAGGALYVIGQTNILLGDWDAAADAARALLSHHPNEEGALATVAWTAGDYQPTVALLQRYLASARDRRNVLGIISLLSTLADVYLQLGQLPEAATAADEAVELLSALESGHSIAGMLPPLAEALTSTGAPNAAVFLDRADAAMERTKFFAARPRLARARGLWMAGHSRTTEALLALRDSAEYARSQGALVELGRTLAAVIPIARAAGDLPLATTAHTEHEVLIKRLGPGARGLAWAAIR